MKVSSIFFAISMAVLPITAYAGGSMAPEVRVIVVHPSRTIRALNEAYEMDKLAKQIRRASERAEEQAAQRIEREREKADTAADKAYAHKLKCQKSICKN